MQHFPPAAATTSNANALPRWMANAAAASASVQAAGTGSTLPLYSNQGQVLTFRQMRQYSFVNFLNGN